MFGHFIFRAAEKEPPGAIFRHQMRLLHTAGQPRVVAFRFYARSRVCLGGCQIIRAEANIRDFEHRFQLVCWRIAIAMGQKGTEIWAEESDLQPVHG